MLWIKRNIFLAVGGVIALGLLGVCGYYFWNNYQENIGVEGKLEEAKQELKRLYDLAPFPHDTNKATAKAELQRLQTAINQTKQSFSPLAYQRVKGQAFKPLLDTTIDELQKKADHASVTLPASNRYAFTFTEQQKRLQFSEGSFPTLPEQLAEIKAISTILFDAKVNKLASMRRGRVTADDPPSSPDYHEMKPDRTIASGAIASPFVIEFNSFSSELATVMEGFYKSSNGLLVKAIEVRPLDEAAVGGAMPANNLNLPPPSVTTNGFRRTNPLPERPVPTPVPTPGAVPPRPPAVPPGARPPAGAVPGAGEGLKTALDEKMLKIVVWVDVLKTPAK